MNDQERIKQLETRVTELEAKLKDMHKKCMTVTEYRNADYWGVDEEWEDE